MTNQLLSLLRLGLHLASVEDEQMSLPCMDWESFYTEAKMQTVTGVAFDGMQKAVEEGKSKIPRDLLLRWYGEVMLIEQRNEKLNNVLLNVAGIFHHADIPFVVMKGQTIGVMYPNAKRRQPGDIDVFVWDGTYSKACQALMHSGGIKANVSPEKHAEIEYQGVIVEVHHVPLNLYTPSAQRYLKRLDYEHLVEICDVESKQIPAFKKEFNCVYMLGHMVHHLLSEGLGLRQVCDWMILMKQMETSGYIQGEIHTYARSLHLENALSVFITMGKMYFGLSHEHWQWIPCRCSEQQAWDLLKYIMNSGNFGKKKKEKRDSKSLTGNISNAWFYSRHMVQLYNLAPSEVWWFFPIRTWRWLYKKFIF